MRARAAADGASPPTERPRWAVYLDGRRVGEIHEKTIGRARALFYEAFAVDPGTGRLVSLDVSIDQGERVAAVLAYTSGPEVWAAYREAQQLRRWADPFPGVHHSTP